MKKIYLFIFCLAFASCTPIRKLYVKYGAAKPMLDKRNDGITRIFFDRYGTLYPDIGIDDNDIMNNDSNLYRLFANHPDLLKTACQTHLLPDNSSADDLQQKLIDDISSLLNDKARDKKVVILIHGFNKHPQQPVDSNSVEEFRLMREKIIAFNTDGNFHFVEIYWDGCTWANGSEIALIKGVNSAKIWNNAQAASNLVGTQLRRILEKIGNDNTVIITHSLGAGVITTALFNVDKFSLNKQDNFFRQKVWKAYEAYPTPVRKFRVGMLAAAIPGKNTFDEYLCRTPQDNGVRDNYYFVLGYNTNDIIITKWLFAHKFGSTTLGSRLDEVRATNIILKNFGVREIDPVSFSISNGKQQTQHAFSAYIANTGAMDTFLTKVFQ